MSDLSALRRAYAEKVAGVVGCGSPALVEAFATVPREVFVGPGPWKVFEYDEEGYRDTPNDDPAHIYDNVLVALDPARNLNNGEPAFHMTLLGALAPVTGEHVVQVGAGTGYYSAILAELVGTEGRVTAIEYDENLAGLVTANLVDVPQARVVCGDGTRYDTGSADAVYVCAGVTAPSPLWLRNLRAGGRLIVPLTTVSWEGHVLEVKREGDAFAARFVRSCGAIPCMGARDRESEALLAEAFARGGTEEVRSLRTDTHDREPSCWLHGGKYCLSRNHP